MKRLYRSTSIGRRPGSRRARGAPSRELSFQALFTLVHGPVVVHREDGLEKEREVAEERLVRADSPVVDDVHVGAALFEGPHAATHEIAERFDGEAVRLSVL